MPRILSSADELNTRPCRGIVGRSAALLIAIAFAKKVAITGLAVLLMGETGTGKDVLARYIHDESGRTGAFVTVDCTRLEGDLLNSELFGHVKGAFTGAIADRQGLARAADQGTLFLNEVAKLPLKGQATLLRLLDDGTFTKVGSEKEEKVNARVIAATNQDLKTMVDSGKFLEDLYYRLQTLKIDIPPLRDRRQDIPLIAADFLKRNANIGLLGRKPLTPDAIRRLCAHDWPGNVRELQSVLCQATAIAEGEAIVEDDVVRALGGCAQSIVMRFSLIMLSDEGHVHLTTLVKLTGVPESTVRREMQNLIQDRGIRSRNVNGRRVYYAPGPARGDIPCATCSDLTGSEDEPQCSQDVSPPVPQSPRVAAPADQAVRTPAPPEKERAALELVARDGVVTRMSLAAASGIPASTASKVLRRMVKAKVLVNNGKRKGRKAGYVLAR